MTRRVWIILAWSAVALVVFATLSPINWRPHLASQHREHFAAFGLIGLLFSLAYPRRALLVVCAIFAAAIALELLQLLTPDRHARAIDAAFKCAGGLAGVVFAQVLIRLRQSGS